MTYLPIPPEESIIYENGKLYVCLATEPLTKGHTIVVWKGGDKDINSLSCENYEYLMNMVDVARETLLAALGVEKVYLLYMDEARHVHWHLVPRYNENGFDVFSHEPNKTDDFSLVGKIKPVFDEVIRRHKEFNKHE